VRTIVSIIMPAFNCETTASQSILSALNQTISSIEIIVIDDYSSDETYNIIEKIALTDNRIKLYRNHKNMGVAETRNIGCKYAIGNYIAFIDSDDIWQPDKLEKQLFSIEQKKADICYTSYYIMDDYTNRLYSVPTFIDYNGLLKENVIGCSTVLLKAEIMKHFHFDSTFFHEDYVLWLALLRKGYKATGIEEALVFYRKGGRSANKIKAAKNRWVIYRKAEKLSLLQSLFNMYFYIQKALVKHM
jgi:teichuronic acid biosynthesis glycosyltransferase TuaG